MQQQSTTTYKGQCWTPTIFQSGLLECVWSEIRTYWWKEVTSHPLDEFTFWVIGVWSRCYMWAVRFARRWYRCKLSDNGGLTNLLWFGEILRFNQSLMVGWPSYYDLVRSWDSVSNTKCWADDVLLIYTCCAHRINDEDLLMVCISSHWRSYNSWFHYPLNTN